MSVTGLPVLKPYAAVVGANVGAIMEMASLWADRVLMLGNALRADGPSPRSVASRLDQRVSLLG